MPKEGKVVVALSRSSSLKMLKKANNHRLFEQYMKYLLKLDRCLGGLSSPAKYRSVILDHFVRREVARKMKEEEELASMEELVYRLPFKMKVQTLMEENKAYGERTKEDLERMEKEAKLEIERNFPSYFDEFQRAVFSG